MPRSAGAYALLIGLATSLPLPPRFGVALLPAGRYVYLGSARGPGGIRGRCARHLARPARRRWHVDWLTSAAASLHVLPLPDHRECELLRCLLGGAGLSVPLAGFGSSDCREGCPAHLLALAATVDVAWLGSTLERAGATVHASKRG